MTTYPPMTGLESHMEEEIANQAHKPNEARKAQKLGKQQSKPTPSRETKLDREVEEVMHLDQ